MDKYQRIESVLQRYSGNFYQVNRFLIPHLGFWAATFLDVLLKHERMVSPKHEEFYYTAKSIERCTGLNYRKQTSMINELKNKGVLTVRVSGIPAKRYFKINFEKIDELMLKGVDRIEINEDENEQD